MSVVVKVPRSFVVPSPRRTFVLLDPDTINLGAVIFPDNVPPVVGRYALLSILPSAFKNWAEVHPDFTNPSAVITSSAVIPLEVTDKHPLPAAEEVAPFGLKVIAPLLYINRPVDRPI